jgi:hypothetical protein
MRHEFLPRPETLTGVPWHTVVCSIVQKLMPRRAPLDGRQWADLVKRERELVEQARAIVRSAPRQRYTIAQELADLHRLIEQVRPQRRRA